MIRTSSSPQLVFLLHKGILRMLTLHQGTQHRVTLLHSKAILHKGTLHSKAILHKGTLHSSLAMLLSMLSLSRRKRVLLVSWKDAWQCFAVAACWMLAFEEMIQHSVKVI